MDRGVFMIIKRAGKYLLLEKSNSRFCVPAGKVEKDESPFQAAIRELQEEVGITATRLTLKESFFYKKNGKISHKVFIYEVNQYIGKPQNKEPKKHKRVFFGQKELINCIISSSL